SDAGHDAGEEHEVDDEAADRAEDGAEDFRVHSVDELQRPVHCVKDRLGERLHSLGEVDEQFAGILEQVAHTRKDIPRRLEEVEQGVGTDERVGPVPPPFAGVDQPVGELTSEGTESIDEVPEPRDGIAYPSAEGGGVILYVSTDAGEPLGRLVGCELTGPYPSQVAEALAGILKERGKRLGVPSHDGFDTGLQAREQPLA